MEDGGPGRPEHRVRNMGPIVPDDTAIAANVMSALKIIHIEFGPFGAGLHAAPGVSPHSKDRGHSG